MKEKVYMHKITGELMLWTNQVSPNKRLSFWFYQFGEDMFLHIVPIEQFEFLGYL